MNPSPSTHHARKLVHAFGNISATEDLILFVAGTDNMLEFCRNLLEQYDHDTHGLLIQEVNAQCAAQAVLPGALYAEIRKVLLALNRFHDAGRNHYEILGLPEGASMDKVKQTYRSLSKQHHPDRQHSQEKDARRFMEIAGAYHAIMDAATRRQTPAHTPPWRKRSSRPSGSRRRDQRKFFLGLFAIVLILAGASVFLTGIYSKKIAVSRMSLYEKKPGQVSGKPALTALSTPETVTPLPSAESEPAAEEARTYPVADMPVGKETPAADVPVVSNPPAALPPLPDRVEQDIPATTPSGHARSRPDSPQEREQQTKKLQDRRRRINTINTSLEISSLVNQYSRLYNRREFEPFLTLFAEHASENGDPLETFTEQYRSLFAHTQTIDLKISDLTWSKQQDVFLTRGNFNVSYTYRDGSIRNHTGNVTFNLVREQDTLKILSLEYTFN